MLDIQIDIFQQGEYLYHLETHEGKKEATV